LLSAPRTDPYVPNSGIRFLPRVVDGEASVKVGLDSRPLLPSRTPSRPCDALSWLGVQSVSPGFAFPSVPALGSTGSATGCPALFVGFTAVGSEEARSVAFALTSVRRSNGTCSFPAFRFHGLACAA